MQDEGDGKCLICQKGYNARAGTAGQKQELQRGYLRLYRKMAMEEAKRCGLQNETVQERLPVSPVYRPDSRRKFEEACLKIKETNSLRHLWACPQEPSEQLCVRGKRENLLLLGGWNVLRRLVYGESSALQEEIEKNGKSSGDRIGPGGVNCAETWQSGL